MKDLLFSKLIIFVNTRKVQHYYLSHEKYFKSSDNSGKILRDIMKHEEPKESI